MNNRFSQFETGNPKDNWLILGPGGGGCVHTLTINPQRPEMMVVACDMTAGYLTHNGGQSWRVFNLKSRQYAYAFDLHTPNRLWVGSSGLFRSADAGATWQLIFPAPDQVTGETRLGDESRHCFISQDNWPGKTIHAITVDPEVPGQIFIGIKKYGPEEPFDFLRPVNREGILLYTTKDDGASWREVAEISASDIFLIVVIPTSPQPTRELLAITEKGVFVIKTEKGEIVSVPLPEDVRYVNHAAVSIDPLDGSTVIYLIAFIEQPGGQAGATILRSHDYGQTWQDCRAGLAALNPASPPWVSQVSACGVDGRRVWTIVERCIETTEDMAQVIAYGILRSDDAGETWTWVVKQDDFHEPENREFGWAERDYGARWGDITGDLQISPKGRFAWDVVASPVNPDVCYTMDFSTIYTTKDAGKTWQQLVTNIHPDGSVSSRGIDVLGNFGVIFDPCDPEHLVLPTTDAGIFHSLNGGRTWRHDLAGVPREWINTCYWAIFDPEVKGRAWSVWSAMHDLPRIKMLREELFARDQGGICKTDDGLFTWHPSASGLPALARPTHIVLDPGSPIDSRTLYAALYWDGVYKSVDDGQTWVKKAKGIDPRNTFAWRLLLHPDGTLYVVIVKNRMVGEEYPGMIYKSTDGAETWQVVRLPEDVDFPNDLTCDFAGRLYLACWPHNIGSDNIGGGVYASNDGGDTWMQIFDPQTHVYTVSVDPLNHNNLYISTFDAALYQSTDRGQTWKQVPGFDFQWGYRPVPDPHHPGMLYLTTFGCSIWYGTLVRPG